MPIGSLIALCIIFTNQYRFNLAVGVLRERNLVDRMSSPEGGYLRTHRALQRSILHHLDRNLEQRSAIFEQALLIVRQAFPRQNLMLRADPTNWPINQRYLPHITSLNAAFIQSQPPMPNSMVFAELLRDGSAFLFNWHVREEALLLLKTAEAICHTDQSSSIALKILPFIESDLGIYDQYNGVAARESGLEHTKRALTLYQDHNARLEPEKLVQNDLIAIGRFQVDHGCCWLAKDDVSRAGEMYDLAFSSYQVAGTEETLKVRFGTVYTFRGLIQAAHKNFDQSKQWMEKGLGLIQSALGTEAHFALWCQLLVGMGAFARGDIASALEIQKQVLQGRLRLHAKGHHEILSSQYMVAVAQQRSNDLESAE